ncbi:efflux RND transporter periplasmic adaptor subunit [Amycolatopsis keratiniphila]|uniref:Uncharacterized protein n=1 Tax=Amycolatopsis keratiniphila subsp. keratiniphila TaxID=227715 RepID=A0A1W2LRI6_9PSEU|nr:HlyD family efflux transporter periplasmic adaptor subunit [Amycolatopsis keratiniphila]ONF66965.1 hypothetical protein AVR91_0223775 [Amycolatopsis keratiniphila subsp. keratiniphila]
MRSLLSSRVARWVVAVVAVGLVGAVGAVSAADGDTSTQYRLATASTGDVQQTVSTSGTVDLVNRADVTFGIDGTLADLVVAVGDHVTAGQPLGALDTKALQAAVDAAEAELADATAAIEADEQEQVNTAQEAVKAESATNPSTAQSGATASAQRSGQPADSARADLAAQVTKQQQAVRTAQTTATEAITAAKSALATQTEKCADAYQPGSAAPTEPTASEPATVGPSARNAACAEALNAVTAAQDAVSKAQSALQSTINDLAGSLDRAVAEAQKSTSSSGAAQPSSSDAERSGNQTQNGGQSQNGVATSGSSSAGGIAAGQARIDRAKADLMAAEQSLAHANLTAPIAGEVASVEMTEGGKVTAGDTAVVLIGSGAAVIETTVPVERISDIDVGMEATVTPSGANEKVAGKVTRIGRLPDTASDSVAYPVTVTVDQPTVTMPAGSTASVSIAVSTIANVVTVPTSALTRGGRDTVTVYADGQTSTRQVTVGAVGPLRTEIQKGLTAGEQVVLADLDKSLPSAKEPAGGGPGRGPGGGLGGVPGGGPMGRPAGR